MGGRGLRSTNWMDREEGLQYLVEFSDIIVSLKLVKNLMKASG